MGKQEGTSLRRSPAALVMEPFGPMPVLLAGVFIVTGASEPVALFFAAPFVLLAVMPLLRPFRLCGDSLVVPRFIVKEFRQPLDELTAIEVGTYHWSGFSGYRGKALVLHAAHESRLVYHSLYCGERRLRDWVSAIEAAGAFDGAVYWSNESERWEGPHHFPLVQGVHSNELVYLNTRFHEGAPSARSRLPVGN